VSYTVLYNDVKALMDGTLTKGDEVLDDILELQQARDELHDRFMDLREAMSDIFNDMDQALGEAKK
jgi:hypothetical protein